MNLLKHVSRLMPTGALFAFLTVGLALGARANAITDKIKDGTIVVQGGHVSELGEEVVIVYSNDTTSAQSLNITVGQATARVLAVGGGGGGGGSSSAVRSYGGGGGGGAGGMVEVDNLQFMGSYSISVGKGGAGVAVKNALPGTSGGDTTIQQSGVQVAGIAVAKGGGGGGAGGIKSTATAAEQQKAEGQPGGSGGGASFVYVSSSSGIAKSGGSGVTGQGTAGGSTLSSTASYWIGGGGGGAGAKGGDVATYTVGVKGGEGKVSNITGSDVWYAGGGAGGDAKASNGGAVAGSKGGGGSGGDASNKGSRDGADGLGGGGGGAGGSSTTGCYGSGRGGDGVLVIRLSNYMSGGVKPPVVAPFVYDGQPKTAAEATANYTLSQDITKTAAGNYTLRVTLTEAGKKIGWDESTGIVGDYCDVNWSIAKRLIEKPVAKAASYAYTGSEQIGFTNGVWYTVEEAKRKATDAGTYTPTATLTDAVNTGWADGAPTTRTDLTWTIAKGRVAKPAATAASWAYTGSEQVGFVENAALYAFDAANRATNAGTYTPTATLKDAVNTEWADGQPATRDDFSWTIAKGQVAKPAATAASWAYTGSEQVGFVENAALYAFDAANRATNAGTYTPTATLKDAVNTEWADGQPATRDDFSWTIGQKTVVPPAADDYSPTYAYDGTKKSLFTALDLTWYEVVDESTVQATDAGNYTCTLHLKHNESAINVTWTDSTSDDKGWNWKITPAANEIFGFRMDDWQVGAAEREPSVSGVKFGSKTAVTYAYSDSATGPWDSAVKLTEPGYHYVRAHLDGAKNWSEVSQVKRYCVWTHPEEVFSDYVDVTVSGYAGSSKLTDFPVLLRIREAMKDNSGAVTGGLPGFTYARAGNTGDEIRFVMKGASKELDRLLPYEVEKWDVAGESLVWVKVPQLAGAATAFRMYWHADDPKSANDPTAVWTDYVGVWHFCGTAEAVLADATGNGLTAYPSNATYSAVSTGKFGPSIKMNGGALYAPNYEHLVDSVSNFTYLCWTKATGYASGQVPFSGATTESLKSPGSSSNTPDGWRMQMNNSKTSVYWRWAQDRANKPVADLSDNWGQLGFVAAPGSVRWYASFTSLNGGEFSKGTYHITSTTADLQLAGAGFTVDEIRLAKTARSSDWMTAEFDSVNDVGFCTFGLVNVDGNWVDYWTTRPSIAKHDWEAGTITESDVQKGVLKVNNPVAYCYVTMPAEKTTNTVVQTEGGTYLVVCGLDPAVSGYTLLDGPATLEYAVIGHNYYDDLGGTVGGRILLCNNDSLPGHEISGQGYWQTDTSGRTYWEHLEEISSPSLLPYVNNRLKHALYINDGAKISRLWLLEKAFIGNIYRSAQTHVASRNYLPYSATGEAMGGESVALSPKETANVILRNEADAVVYSPCYSNGLGTVFFDTVNAWVDDIDSYVRVEIATQTAQEGLPPTDENCALGDDPFYYLTHRGNIELGEDQDMWEPVVPTVLIKTASAEEFVVDSQKVPISGDVKLNITSGGGNQAYYRIIAPVNKPGYVRFRIRRQHKSGTAAVNANLILLDNIIAATPSMAAKLSALGNYDKDLTGKQVLGQSCALDKPFPAWTDSGVRGRAKIEYETFGQEIDTSKFVASARFNYRWRYLNQAFEPWKTLYLNHEDVRDGILTTVQPLEFRRAAGDIEWYCDMTLQAPSYKYVDYSGLAFAKPTGDYSAEIRAVTNRMNVAEGDYLASAGSDWFARLREGKSDWQGMQVVIEAGADAVNVERLAGAHDLEIIDDNMWRGFVNVPTNAEGTCSFTFRGVNLQSGSPTVIAKNTKTFGLASAGQTASIPASGSLVENGSGVQFKIDHAAGYLEFKVSDRYKTFQVGRAEYQDFNYWNDAHTSGDKFRIDTKDTNSVNVSGMNIETAATGKWPLFQATKHDKWDEWFEASDYDPTPGARFEKNVFHQSVHETPNAGSWSAQNITFVSESFVSKADQKLKSGMAGKLLGNGNGLMDFTNAEAPQGIERIDLSVRLGQSDTFDAFACCDAAYRDDNYMLFSPVTMSHNTKADGSETGDMAVGASVSLVGYHKDKVGCYEVRCERLYSGAQVRLSLWKWTYRDQKYTSTRLAYRDFDYTGKDHYKPICWSYEKDANGNPVAESQRRFYGMFISFKTVYGSGDTPTETKIVCGLSNGKKIGIAQPWKYFSYSGDDAHKDIEWYGLYYEDTTNPHGWGRYGMTSKDCPAQFVMPAHRKKSYDETKISKLNDNADTLGSGGKYFAVEQLVIDDGTDPQFVDDRYDLNDRRVWTTNPGRCECFTNYAANAYYWIGLHAPTDVSQTLELYLKRRGENESYWAKASEPISVSGYGFQAKSFDLKQTGQWDVRLRTGSEKAIDIVVDNVTQYKWQADDLPANRHSEADFYFTQCYVETNAAAKTNFVRMQPARGEATRPISIRSPLLDGLGKLTFRYEGVSQNAEVWVQVATNRVHGNMTGTSGYNESITSVEPGEAAPVGTWTTVAKYKYDAAGAAGYDSLGASGAKSVYLGWHNHPQRPLKGVYRLFIPPAVVARAGIEATNATKRIDYGQLTVTKLTCTDEPGFSDRSWRGWNMRTIGNLKTDKEPADAEKRMNLVDMKIADGGAGLVGALNDSVNDVYVKEASGDRKVNVDDAHDEYALRLKSSYPAIYSPQLRPVNARSGVGSVTFKARLYSTTGAPETTGGGQVSVYGSKDPTGAEGTWKLLTTHEVTGSVFSNYTWSAGNELYTAVKIEIRDPSVKTKTPAVDRIVLDEIVIGEKVPPTINFEYARPFRNDLFAAREITDILSPAEQPLAGESWGVQTKLSLQQLTDEIDVERGFEVYFWHKRGTAPWGYGNWKDATEPVKLVQVGDPSNLVFRSIGDSPKSLVEPATQGGEVVQFMLKVKYYDRGGKSDEITMGSDWAQPDWFYPLDYNAENGGYDDEKNFAAYTVLDTVSPGRAWINEVNWNDGPKAQNGGKACVTNQYVEICIPSGVDMAGWKLRFTDMSGNERVFAKFGDAARGIPARKVSGQAVNGYEFFVLQSPQTRDAGGIRYPGTTTSAADATWYPDALGTGVSNGTLEYGSPYQFELVRPSGIVEHQLVLDGTNTLSEFEWAYIYDGTNLVRELDVDGSPIRFYAGRDLARKADRKTFASVGVTGGRDDPDTANWPGGSNTWTEAMGFTPGRINAGQTIPKGWFLAPNGTNSWVYFVIGSDHVSQKVGAETNRSQMVVVPQGGVTSVVYTVDNWYEADVTNDTKGVVIAGRPGSFRYEFSPTGTTYVTATARPQSKLATEFGLDAKNPYSPAVLNWLRKNYGEASADDIRLARFKGLQNTDLEEWLTLTDMYWLDIPPVPATPEEELTNGGTNWWLRGGISKMGADHRIYRERGGRDVTYTNKQVEVTLYVSNACTLAKWAPDKLQGLGNESSADFGGVWTSVTFKVSGKLDLSSTTNFLPFRVFTFGSDSFTDKDAAKPFTAVIDILDPFQSPIGMNYDWHKHPNTKAYFKWAIDTREYPYTTEKLKADSTYPETVP